MPPRPRGVSSRGYAQYRAANAARRAVALARINRITRRRDRRTDYRTALYNYMAPQRRAARSIYRRVPNAARMVMQRYGVRNNT